jgi:hypothetical protein
MSRCTLRYFLFGCIASIASLAQIAAPPVPQRLVVHSNVLNEDRMIWVRMPAAAQGKKESYPVLYMAVPARTSTKLAAPSISLQTTTSCRHSSWSPSPTPIATAI